MKEIPVPGQPEARARRAASLKRLCLFWNILFFGFAVLALACVIALVVSLIVFGLNGRASVSLFYALMGGFSGGALVCATASFLFFTVWNRETAVRTDFEERCDGEESFFVGEGTLATFRDKLVLHGRGNEEIEIPYEEIRFFSVCTRRAPREKGEWSVVLQIPARYVARKAEKDMPPVLIQAEAKERLYRTLERHGLALLGEQPPKGKVTGKKFRIVKKFSSPSPRGRKAAIVTVSIGGVAAAAGVLVAVFVHPTAGAIAAAVGVLLLLRGIFSLFKSNRALAVCGEGLYWKEESVAERVFLKWEEIVSFGREGEELRVVCAYGLYRFPAAPGAEEYLKEHYPEKWREKA